MDVDKIGKFILEQRKKLGLTQFELANQLNVTSQAVSKWENGRGIPDIELLKKLSEVFGVDVSELLNGEENTDKKSNQFSASFARFACFIILIALFLGVLWAFPENEEDFEFASITTTHELFSLKGVVAYNDQKKSLFISDVKYLEDDTKNYYGAECILYEQVGWGNQKIGQCGTINSQNTEELYTISELLQEVTFNLDNYSCSCRSRGCDNLLLEVVLQNKNKQLVTYKIPLEVVSTCGTQRNV